MSATDTEALNAALILLTLITGDNWDRDRLVAQASSLKGLARQTLLKQGVSASDADEMVDERWEAYGDPEPATVRSVREDSAASDTAPKMDLSPGVAPTGEELRARVRRRMDEKNWQKPEPVETPASDS
ncbi:hypothetical protein GJ25_gp044 [Mycobacterium phage Hawkeye]|uniref:Uncharacterized protein n=1 Tax=Mycobacterium phage Hawkeye TaxID=1458711 RepID=X2KT21_9CAUD|nr:hypothetical protein GJ25_gp044 [Mycobacterium phage Hawkeye]AHN84055.1 hypothetical protein PBI_HAWKEYE_44 [Mycobacterium phage Hawkeye]